MAWVDQTSLSFRRPGWLKASAAIALATAFTPATVSAESTGKTYGFVVTSLFTAIYETQYMDECPDGLAVSNDALWWKALSPELRDKLTNGGEIEPTTGERREISILRGPRGEDVCWNPTLIQDPPLRTVQGDISYGLNLDGTRDGHATASSCKHQKFTGPSGEPAIDNQIYRILGCQYGWRKHGYVEMSAQGERRDTSQGVTFIEVSGVDDLHNDPDVTVTFERISDSLPKDNSGNILPYGSYRLTETSNYGAKTHGKIVNGVLTTDPVDAHLPFYGNLAQTGMYIRGLRLQLEIAVDGSSAKGLIAGYHDFASWWDYIQRISFLSTTGQFSCPALYEAAKRLADGYPDPKNGECTALSAAYRIEAVPGFAIHESGKNGPDVAAAGPSAQGR